MGREFGVKFVQTTETPYPRSVRVFDRTIPSNHYVNFYEDYTVKVNRFGRENTLKDGDFEMKLLHFEARPKRFELDERGEALVKKIKARKKVSSAVEGAKQKVAEVAGKVVGLKPGHGPFEDDGKPEAGPEGTPEEGPDEGGPQEESPEEEDVKEEPLDDEYWDSMPFNELKKIAKHKGIKTIGKGRTREAITEELKVLEPGNSAEVKE